jgi:hypothetical protein
MLVWQNKEVRGDHLDGKKWAAGRPGASLEQVSASEECALQRQQDNMVAHLHISM